MSRSSVRISCRLRDQLREAADERELSYDELLREMLHVHNSLAQRDAEWRERLGLESEATSSGG